MGGRLRVPERVSTTHVMGLIWAGFTVGYVAFFYVFQDAREIADTSLDGYLEVILLGVPTVVLLASTIRLQESGVDADLRPRIVAWTLGLAALFVVAMHTALFVIETQFDPGEQWLILLLSAGFGASAGSVLGMQSIASKQRERERNRSIEIARRKERERSQLEYLNQYLRHEVLNEATKIIGNATLLDERAELVPEHRERVGTIRDSGEEIAEFIESIRKILDTAGHDPELRRVDLVSVIEGEIERANRAAPSPTIDLEGPDEAAVLAGDLVDRVFRNLIENAIEHNGPAVTITLSVSVGEEWVTVTVRDDGDGIPAPERDRLFDPPESGDHGYGLFLTRNLVEVYGGRLELGETGADGTAFTLRFRQPSRAEPSAAEGAASRSPG